MRFKLGFFGLVISILSIHCISENNGNAPVSENYWIKPEAGTSVNLGDQLTMQLKLAGNNADSIIYYADSTRLTIKKDTSKVIIETKNLPLGNRLITARIYRKGIPEEINTNIVLKSALIPKKFSYLVLKTFDHDTSSYTQGLEFHNGSFYESDGGYSPETGYSSLRRVEPATGKVLQRVDFAKTFFAEGLTIVDDKIVLLTWQAKIGLVLDKNSFKELSEFPYQNSPEGWGLCSDNKMLYKSDGTNLIYFLNRENYREEGYIEVFDRNGPVDQLNELEFINGMIYANVYLTNRIVIINPKNGQVTGEIDMSDLLPSIYNYPGTDVLNGIAWDAKGKRLFVTGKRWAKLYEVKLNTIKD